MTPLPGCRACAAQETTERFRVAGYLIVACARCGSLTTAARMEEPEAEAYYGHAYFHGGDYRDYPATETTVKRNFEHLIQRLTQIHAGGTLLEVGCAYGFFLDLAAEHWRVMGIDISQDAIAACAPRFPGAVFQGDIRHLDLPAGTFDWVVAWDVLEHLDNPRASVDRIVQVLKPGGRLALTTGDVSSLGARLLGRRWRLMTPPSHLTFFSRAGMTAMLSDSGLEDIRFETAGYHRTFDFAVFRVLGPGRYQTLTRHNPGLPRFLQSKSFYIDLGDIMFVTARKPNA